MRRHTSKGLKGMKKLPTKVRNIIIYIYHDEYQWLSIKKSARWRIKINFNIVSQIKYFSILVWISNIKWLLKFNLPKKTIIYNDLN